MAKKEESAAPESTNKSQAIRAYVEAHPQAKPKEVVAGLAAQGIEVSPNLVSMLKSKMKAQAGESGGKRGRPAGSGQNAQQGPQSVLDLPPALLEAPSFAQLRRAAQIAQELGGIEQAQNALSALKLLQEKK